MGKVLKIIQGKKADIPAFMLATIEALKALGNRASIVSINKKIIEIEELTPSELTVRKRTEDGTVSFFNYHCDQARIILRHGNEVDTNNRGIWTLTESGKAITNTIETKEIFKNYQSTDTNYLHEAAKLGHLKTVKKLLNSGAEVNEKIEFDRTPLHEASKHRHTKVVRELLNSNAEINAKMRHGTTALHLAAKNGHLELVKLLVEKGANVKAKMHGGKTPLKLAAQNCHTDVKDYLKEFTNYYSECRDEDWIKLIFSIKFGDVKKVKSLIENFSEIVHVKSILGQTPLHVAAKCGHTNIVKILVNAGGDANATMRGGYTPLHFAAKCGHTNLVKILVNAGGDVNAMTKVGYTPLHFAANSGNAEIVKYFIKCRADINHCAECGRSPIFFAIENGNLKSLMDLISAGAKLDLRINSNLEWSYEKLSSSKVYIEEIEQAIDVAEQIAGVSNVSGLTPLQFAIDCNRIEVVKALIEAGVNVNARGIWGWTPLLWATLSGNVKIISLLLEAGADKNPKLSIGWTPLHCAVASENINAVKKLIEVGAEVNAKDFFGNSPLSISNSKKNFRLAKLLDSKNTTTITETTTTNINEKDSDLFFKAADAVLKDWRKAIDSN